MLYYLHKLHYNIAYKTKYFVIMSRIEYKKLLESIDRMHITLKLSIYLRLLLCINNVIYTYISFKM